MGKNIEPFDISHRLVLAVGMVAIQWARVEFTMQKLVIGLLRANGPAGFMLTSGLGNRAIADFLGVVAESARPDAFAPQFGADLKLLVSEFNRVHTMRNKVVHNTWPDSSDDKALALVARFKGKVQFREEVWEVSDVERVADDTVALLTDLNCFARLHRLFDPMDEWEQHVSSTETPQEPVPATFQNPDPNLKELSRRVRSSPA
jgi:hypothetical protein